ncbi:hypothetical protein BKA70DRAFT_1440938 [Coprinopsis sp. MPI-PUGE-AT-0042]|nr:hypothetical protein BKA70DRAFT_1440938 [Coprinopsis sp. MPI-PUGE-AT-0042]
MGKETPEESPLSLEDYVGRLSELLCNAPHWKECKVTIGQKEELMVISRWVYKTLNELPEDEQTIKLGPATTLWFNHLGQKKHAAWQDNSALIELTFFRTPEYKEAAKEEEQGSVTPEPEGGKKHVPKTKNKAQVIIEMGHGPATAKRQRSPSDSDGSHNDALSTHQKQVRKKLKQDGRDSTDEEMGEASDDEIEVEETKTKGTVAESGARCNLIGGVIDRRR